MKGRGRTLVSLIEDRFKENINPNSQDEPMLDSPSHNMDSSPSLLSRDHEPFESGSPITTINTNISHSPPNSMENEIIGHNVVTTDMNTTSSTSQRQPSTRPIPNYYVSPIHSDESDIDDSDNDPNFIRPIPKKMLSRVVPETPDLSTSASSSSSSSSSGSSSSSSSKSSSSSSSSDSEDAPAPCNRPQVSEASNPTAQPNPLSIPDSVQNPTEKRGKKRLRKPKNWKTASAKQLRNSGKPYQSTSKSKRQIPARKLRQPCANKCRLKCKEHIDETSRQQLLDAFWSMADLQRQREFIVRHSQEIKPKYRYSSTQNFRALNSAFYFESQGNKIRVCKHFFKATLDINDRVIKTAISKKTDTGTIEGELRGKHGHQPTVSDNIKKSVHDFIDSIPRIESHYLRAQTSREYISSDRSLADIYRDYKALQEKEGLEFASKSTFSRIFNTEFNISFHIPKKDQCDLCESYKNSDEEGKRKLQEAYDTHLKEKELARKEKETDKNRTDGAVVAVYDLQAVMQVPKGQVSLFYYKSRINCLNFTISDLHAKQVMCYFWDETEAKRGAVDIGSCVFAYVEDLLKDSEEDIDIIFYSDNCCGQQKNKYLLSMYAYIVEKMRVKSITHKFLIRGHSQNEGDNVHSVIEKQVQRFVKSASIYTPQQYTTLIRTAKKSGDAYKVIEMTHDKFYDLKTLQETWGNNFSKDEDRNQVKWHDIKVVRVEKETPGVFLYKTSYANEDFKKTFVRSRRGANTFNGFPDNLPKAYAEKIPLAAAKKSDIQELINKNVIPRQFCDTYYNNVLNIN